MMAVSIGQIITSLSGIWLYIWFIFVSFNSIIKHSGIKLKIKLINDYNVILIDDYYDIHHKI